MFKAKKNKICGYNSYMPKILIAGFTSVTAFVMFSVCAYASSLGNKLTEIFKSLYGDVSAIFDIAAIVCLGVCLLTLLFGRSSKSAESSYTWMKTIIGCFIIFHFLGTLVPWLSGLFGTAVSLPTAETAAYVSNIFV